MAAAGRDVPLPDLTTGELVLRYFSHLEQFEPAVHAGLREAFERALDRAPNDATAWGCLANLYALEFEIGLNARPDSVARARAAAERAIAVDPTAQYGWLSLASALFHAGDADGARHATERAIALNPLNTHALAYLGALAMLAGRWDEGMAMNRRAVALNPHLAGYVHLAPFLDAYRRGDDEAALASAKRINIPLLATGHMAQAAAAGQLGRVAEARAAFARLRRIDPALCEPSAIRAVLGRFLRDQAIADRLAEGFEKALALPAGATAPPSRSGT
jgi:tetratricopeptide (TPR) repeat protein